MKRFAGFVIKEFLHIFRDYRTMVILFGIPVAQILIFGFVITNEIRDVDLAVLDMSRDEETRGITERVEASGYFTIQKRLESPGEIEAVLRSGTARAVIVFGQRFAERLPGEDKAQIQIVADASDPNTATLVTNYLNAIFTSYEMELVKPSPVPHLIETQERMVYNPNMEGVYMFVPGTMAMILMLICAMMTSITIAREKETGTMETLLVSPLRPFQIIAGKITPYIVLSFINAITILLLSYFVFGLPVHGSLVLLLAQCLLYTVMALSLGILISTVSNNQVTAMMISMFTLMIPTILLSGFIYPVENMPPLLQWLSYIMPPRYFIEIIKNIMIKGTGILFVWQQTLVIAAMTVVFVGASVLNFKVRLE